MLKYINSNRLSVVILLVLLPVLFWIPSFSKDTVEYIPASGGMPLGDWIIRFNHNFRVLASIIGLLLIIVNGYLLIQLNTVHIFIPSRTQLPLFFYTVLVIGINQLNWLSPALIASTLLIILFYRVFNSYKNDGISVNFLDAGMLISLASLFYFPSIFFFFCLLITLLLIRPFIWREWAFALIGLLMPYAFAMSVYYLIDKPVSELFSGVAQDMRNLPVDLRFSQIITWSYVLLFTIIASYYIARAIDSMKIHARKFFLVFLAYFVMSLLIFLIIRRSGTGMVYFGSIPLAYLFTHYFVKCRHTWVNDIFFILFVLLLIWQRVA
jgi:hypothetical protein